MTERDAFEAWARQTFSHVTNPAEPDPSNPGGYYWPAMHNAWMGWQAAWTASRKQAAEEAARVVEESTLRARQAKAWTNNQPIKPCEIAAAIRAAASIRKEGDQC